MKLKPDEIETHISFCATDRSIAVVYSDDPVIYNKLKRKHTVVERTDVGYYFHIPTEQIVRMSLISRKQKHEKVVEADTENKPMAKRGRPKKVIS